MAVYLVDVPDDLTTQDISNENVKWRLTHYNSIEEFEMDLPLLNVPTLNDKFQTN